MYGYFIKWFVRDSYTYGFILTIHNIYFVGDADGVWTRDL